MTLLGAFLVFVLLQLHKGAGEFSLRVLLTQWIQGRPPGTPAAAMMMVGRGLVLPVCLNSCIYNRDGEDNGDLYCFGGNLEFAPRWVGVTSDRNKSESPTEDALAG
jgi:hypothetical protein